MNFKTVIIVAILLSIPSFLKARNVIDSITLKSDIKLYGNLYHQHHDFFDKPFSFQGLEVGLILKRKLFLGLYGSCFVTNLKTEINNSLQYIWIGQSGVHFGYIHNAGKRIHPGIQLNIGAFSLRTDDRNFGLFQTNEAKFKMSGLVISPQIFGELNITDWFNIRTGLSYNLYNIENNSVIQPSDLNNFSFTFGMIFTLNK
jgi:hypothetical protein